MSVIEKLKAKQGFTDVEKDIANYMLHHPEDIAHLAIADLAREAYTSNATIVRFCRKLGLTGYREFRMQFATELERRRGRMVNIDANRPFGRLESAPTILSSIAELMKSAIDCSYASLDPSVVEEVAGRISEATHVFLYGIGDSCLTLQAFAEQLLKLGIYGIVANQLGGQFLRATIAGPFDIAIFATYSGRILPGHESTIAELKRRGCALAAITSLPDDAPELERFDYVLTFPARESPIDKMATFYSQQCMRYILNAIYSCVFAHDYDENEQIKAEIDQALIV